MMGFRAWGSISLLSYSLFQIRHKGRIMGNRDKQGREPKKPKQPPKPVPKGI
jgi:hypothetical protein